MAVITTGFFDGVHLGHRQVLETTLSAARKRGEEAIVITFWPHPRTVLQQDARDFRLLSSLEEKKALLGSCGIDRVEVLPFSRSFAALRADEYLRLLKDRFDASLVVMGYDNRIGCDKLTAGEICACGDLPEIVVAEELNSGVKISSTQIRRVISEGDVSGAREMLGYDYPLEGVVVAGNRVGRTIGFPTANMQLYEPLKLLPGNGVYAVDVEVTGRRFRGMCNIGTRPTVGGAARTIETNIFDFDEDIYGLPIKTSFVRRIRDEKLFPSLDALREQLVRDRESCK
ncbi:MAG: riboflavin biosynthesis protein RibF [Bacteroidales bacterium]|nr:riboflavin biosynthesis protein RibF [Bacteroidales bacterium]